MHGAIARYLQKTLPALAFAIAFCHLTGANSASAAGACPSSFSNGKVFAIVKPLPPSRFNTLTAEAQLNDAMKYIEVIGGKPASPTEWPATLILCVSDQTFCTSTVVGARTILTAAHCFDHVRPAGNASTRGSASVTPDAEIGVICTIHPEYQPVGGVPFDPNHVQRPWSADIAVCAAESDLPIPTAERIVSTSVHPTPGALVTLLGFGCSSPGGGGVVQVLYSGLSSISDVGAANYFFHTKRSVGGPAALCKGDSGGASFTSGGASRSVNGINAIADNNTESWITDLSRPEIRKFVEQQTTDPARHVCGLHPDAKSCRPP